MVTPTRGSDTSEDQIQVNWNALTVSSDQGGSNILSYHLQWDSGSSGGTWDDLLGYPTNSLALTYTVTTSIIAGTSYQFQVQASNIYGFGTYSSIYTIVASDVPEQMIAPVITMNGVDAQIDWIAPYDNSDAITDYDILILKADGVTWLADTTDCDGHDPTIFA